MPRALISAYNKEGVIEFAQGLESLGWEIISTGGTYNLLKQAGLKNLKKVEEITGFPEIMNGRVKTLHPKIHGGLLADRAVPGHLAQAKKNQIGMIDLVAVNLYPFKETISRAGVTEQEAIENIDIGGPSMIRSAAKNFQHVYTVVDPDDYQEVISQLSLKSEKSIEFRRKLAVKAFSLTQAYDLMISNYFSGGKALSLNFTKAGDLRYGENPHQRARLYKEAGISNRMEGIIGAEILHGKELSYNNIIDADSALSLIVEFAEPAAAVIKHTNPCGCAVAQDINRAFKKAYAADAKSAFGGVIVLNRACTKEIAESINKVFAELVIATDYEDQALKILKQKKNVRLLKIEDKRLKNLKQRSNLKDYKKIIGGILEQDIDDKIITEKDLKYVTPVKPSKSQLKDLLFAWKVAKHVKSNAIVITKNGVTIGIGAGQMSRVDSVEIAVQKGGDKISGAALASDAFFPFRDSLDKLAQSGVKSVIQPGGSINDNEVIQACKENKISMVFTGFRAFRH